jgi:hypothetical protein
VTTARPLSNSSVVAMGHGSHTSDNDPRTLEAEKQRNLTGVRARLCVCVCVCVCEGAGGGGWGRQHASGASACRCTGGVVGARLQRAAWSTMHTRRTRTITNRQDA